MNYKFLIQPEHLLSGKRLDQFVHRQLPQFSRSYLQRLIRQGQIRVNQQVVKAQHTIRLDEVVTVDIPPPQSLSLEPEAIPLTVIYEDKDFLVLNKGPGIVVHPAAGNPQGTLVNALLAHCGRELSGIGGVMRPGIVHRLDKDTSGCMVVAKNDRAHQSLATQFHDRQVKKTYLALVRGNVVHDQGEISARLGRHPTHRKKIAVTEKGRDAVTAYAVERRFPLATLVRCHPKTGRTHQIRVHLTKLGHPIIGDRVYGSRMEVDAPRQMLHAHRIAFRHPRTGKELEFTAPIPEDMAKVIKELERLAVKEKRKL